MLPGGRPDGKSGHLVVVVEGEHRVRGTKQTNSQMKTPPKKKKQHGLFSKTKVRFKMTSSCQSSIVEGDCQTILPRKDLQP